MKVSVNAKLYIKDDGYGEELYLKVKFKDPNRILKVRKKNLINSTFYVSRRKFYQEYAELMGGESELYNHVKDMVFDYFIDKMIDVEIKEIKDKHGKKNKFNFEVDINK